MDKLNSWQIGVAAEAYAVAQFTRFGIDVSVQYGANNPEYDLVASRGTTFIKVAVKGSQDGDWDITKKYKKGVTPLEAANEWLKAIGRMTVFCLVQFKDVAETELPRIYLATAQELVEVLLKSRNGNGNSILYEYRERTERGQASKSLDAIPGYWIMTKDRVEQVFSFVEKANLQSNSVTNGNLSNKTMRDFAKTQIGDCTIEIRNNKISMEKKLIMKKQQGQMMIRDYSIISTSIEKRMISGVSVLYSKGSKNHIQFTFSNYYPVINSSEHIDTSNLSELLRIQFDDSEKSAANRLIASVVGETGIPYKEEHDISNPKQNPLPITPSSYDGNIHPAPHNPFKPWH